MSLGGSMVSWMNATARQHFHIYTSMYSNMMELYSSRGLDLQAFEKLELPDAGVVGYVLAGAVVWTLARYLVEISILKPFALRVGLTAMNAMKFPESVWKLVVHTRLWIYTVNLLIYPGVYPYFHEPESVWKDWRLGMEVPADIKWVYFLVTSFYTHSAYASIFMDHKRKDTLAMVIHHIVTLSLLVLSYCTSYFRLGLLVLILMDITDIELEVAKTCVYFRDRQGASKMFTNVCEILANLAFIAFSISWVIFRLHYYPTKVLYATAIVPFNIMSQTGQYFPFGNLFNILLGILFFMNIWWFYFIIDFLVSIACGKLDRLEDIREFEVKDSSKDDLKCSSTIKSQVNGPVANGVSSNAKNSSAVNGIHKKQL